MVDAGSDFAVPLYSGESNVAVGAASTPIHVAALVVQIGRGHWLFRESLHPVFLYTNSALKTTLPARRIFTSMNGSWEILPCIANVSRDQYPGSADCRS